MDANELARLHYLCSTRDLNDSEMDELQDLSRLALSELKALRSLLRDMNAELKRATLEALERI